MKRVIFSLIFFSPVLLFGQSLLTLRNAIDTALEKNLNIQIAKNEAKSAHIGNSLGMAGALPRISAVASDNIYSDDINMKYGDGTETSASGIVGNALNASVSADIVLFNGFKVIATKKRLSSLQQQSEIALNGQVQGVLGDVMLKYFDIVRQQAYLRIIQQTLDVSKEKILITTTKSNVGMASAADMMQAQSDLNTAEQNVVLQQMVIDQAKADLAMLMNIQPDRTFDIDDSIVPEASMSWESIVSALKSNPQWLSSEQQLRINEMLVKETAAQRYPAIKLNADYGFYRADNKAGSTLLNQNFGPSAGLSLQVPIFNGNIYRNQKRIATINLDNAQLAREQLYSQLYTTAYKTFLSYTTALRQIDVQKTNAALSQKLLALVMTNFQEGHATILEVKAAQTSFENASYLLINSQYAAKSAEIELKQLIFQLKY